MTNEQNITTDKPYPYFNDYYRHKCRTEAGRDNKIVAVILSPCKQFLTMITNITRCDETRPAWGAQDINFCAICGKSHEDIIKESRHATLVGKTKRQPDSAERGQIDQSPTIAKNVE